MHVKSVHFLAATLAFSQSTYSVNESNGHLQPVLILSNPSTIDFTVQVFSCSNDSAIGECIHI